MAATDTPADPESASAAIDAFLFDRLAAVPPDAAGWSGSVHLHCTDVAGEWLVVRGDDGIAVVTREHAKGACALRGPAVDLLQVLWRQMGLEAIDVVGDADLAASFVAAADLG
jgi:hypothetical protein